MCYFVKEKDLGTAYYMQYQECMFVFPHKEIERSLCNNTYCQHI